jgi:hypothetical protein
MGSEGDDMDAPGHSPIRALLSWQFPYPSGQIAIGALLDV